MSTFKMSRKAQGGLKRAEALGYTSFGDDSNKEVVRLPVMGVLATPVGHKLLESGIPRNILTDVAQGEHPNFDAFLNKTSYFRGANKQHLKQMALKEYGPLYNKKVHKPSVKELMNQDAEKAVRKAQRVARKEAEASKKEARKLKKSRKAYFKTHPLAAKKIKRAEKRASARKEALDMQDKNMFEQEIAKEHVDVFLNARKQRTVGGISIK